MEEPAFKPGQLSLPGGQLSAAGGSQSPNSDTGKQRPLAGSEDRGLGLSPVRYLDTHPTNQSYSRCNVLSRQMNRSQEQLANVSCLTQGARGLRLFNNPLKGWVIISVETGQVLVANNIFRQLIEVEESEQQIRLWDYIERKGSRPQESLDQLDLDPVTGETERLNGQVVNMHVNQHKSISVSMTMRPLEDPTRILVFLEPVDKTVGRLELDGSGLITWVDEGAETVFQQKQTTLLGEGIGSLLPDIRLPGLEPGSVVKTACTGRTEDDLYFPVSVVLRRLELGSALEYAASAPTEMVPSISVCVWVYSSLSGLILLNEAGEIQECDQSLSCLVLGYGEGELTGRRIEVVLPGFYDDFDLSSADRSEEEDLGCEELSDMDQHGELQIDQSIGACLTEAGTDSSSPLEEISINVHSLNIQAASAQRREDEKSPCHKTQKENMLEAISPPPLFKRPEQLAKQLPDQLASPPVKRPAALKTPVKLPMDMFTSTPAHNSTDLNSPKHKLLRTPSNNSARKPRIRAEQSIERSRHKLKDRSLFGESRSLDDGSCYLPTGCFYGLAKHKNGTEISTLYQIKRITLKSGATIYCVWVSRDTEDIAGRTQHHLTATTLNDTTLASISQHQHTNSESMHNLSQNGSQAAACDLSINTLVDGEFSDNYEVLRQVGRGAYGCVQSAYRKSDNLLVVVKFIYKNKVIKDNWVRGVGGQLIPFEASLLAALSHEAVVSVLDLHQNQSVVQMVMEKHADMDLFEFIDRNPVMDEALASYIFRQIVAGVDFLHNRNILHRDIKDENVIIDNRFRIKLIDFGSATFFKAGDRFTTFYGTVEYCAPEILKGNQYDGQQVEVWALGILLFVLMFGENPFYDVADTVRCELHPPHLDVSDQVWTLIESILDVDPERRASLLYVKEDAWLNQPCAINQYRIQDVIVCSEDEINPTTHYNAADGLPSLDSQTSANDELADTEGYHSHNVIREQASI